MNSGEVGNAVQKFPNIPWIKNDLVKQAVVFLLGAGLVALAVRIFYYAIFPWVLSFNLVFPPGVLTPWIEGWTAERDGIEIYVLYSLLFVCIGLSALFGFGLTFLSPRWRTVVLVIAALATLVHLGSLSFTPPLLSRLTCFGLLYLRHCLRFPSPCGGGFRSVWAWCWRYLYCCRCVSS